jgi:hypothetical protein
VPAFLSSFIHSFNLSLLFLVTIATMFTPHPIQGKAPGLPSPLTMPIAEILDQKFTQAKKEGLAQEDWSAVSLIKK